MNRTEVLGRPQLPSFLTSFVGRERELREVIQLLETGRLVTVSGLPGAGKSRLAIEAARTAAPRFADGVGYADLRACTAIGPAEEAMAVALGIASREPGPATGPGGPDRRPTFDVITAALAERELLLVLDNTEHVVEGVARIASAILAAAPRVRILAASRVVLGVPGELAWHIPLLALPEPGDQTPAGVDSDAVALFADRAHAADPAFDLDDEAAVLVGRIVRRLEGNPLAIELAAARVNVLGVAQLAERLEESLDLVAGSGVPADVDPHQTLNAAIAWGYDLLTPAEQQLFGCLSVFAGDFSPRAAEAVASGRSVPVGAIVEVVGSLVDKSMVQATGTMHERTYRLGDALRGFAEARLESTGNAESVRTSHANYYRGLVASLADDLRMRMDPAVLDRLEAIHPDVSAAIDHAIAVGDAETAHVLVAGLYLFWFARRHVLASELAERVLTMDGEVDASVRSRAFAGAGLLAIVAGESEVAAQRLAAAKELAEDSETVAEASLYLGFLNQQEGSLDEARLLLQDARRGFADDHKSWGVGWAAWLLGAGEFMRGDSAAAASLTEEALAIFRSINNRYGEANALSLLGSVTRALGDPERAIGLHRESRPLWEATKDARGLGAAAASTAIAQLDAGRPEEAAESLAEAVSIVRTLGSEPWLAELHALHGEALIAADELDDGRAAVQQALSIARDSQDPQAQAAASRALESEAWWAWRTGRYERAVTLFAAVSAIDDIPAPELARAARPNPDAALTEARALMGSQVYDSLRTAGRSMSAADAIAYAQTPAAEEPTFGLSRGLTLEELELGERVSAELGGVSERRVVRVAGIRLAGRRRRPSGEKEPLPRDFKASGWFWLAVAVGAVLVWASLFQFPGSRQWWEARDLVVSQWFVSIRTDPLTRVMDAIHAMGSEWFFRPLRWLLLFALIYFKRWRHLFAAIIVFILTEAIVDGLAEAIARPRPFVEILAPWAGYSHPSAPAASVAATLAVIGFTMFPKGKWRIRWMAGAGVAVSLLVISLTYLGVDHLSDGVVGAMFGLALPVVVFRWFAPDSVFPIVYKRGSSAHLDIGGARGRAITKAVGDQLGIEVTSMEPFGLEGSGGSTPIRLTAAGDPDTFLFAKLYSTSHLRADRWYKVGRTILYGALEDEVRFTSVRRLVEYEDYMLLRMGAAGVPSAAAFGFVEITPEREYLIVTEFLQDAEEISTAEVDDAVIDDALLMIRRLWDAGLAHRDVKPANVLVKDGKIRLIDVAFATVRPTPWRQAVDLANMLIILALRTDPERVYNRALRYFAPEDIAEAFAATRSVTIPSQSRSHLKDLKKASDTDVISEFRALAPSREPIAIQRWSTRRIALTIGAAMVLLILLSFLMDNISSGGLV